MSFHLDIEAWFGHTDFEVTHHHPGSGHEFHIDVEIKTEFNGEHNIKLQLDETRARDLRDKLTAALQDCYFEHERPHREEPPLVDRSPRKAADEHDQEVGQCLLHPEFRARDCPLCATDAASKPPCDSAWHQEGHDLGEKCPHCSSSRWDTEDKECGG